MEDNFLRLWKDCGGPALVREHKFHATRKWRFDFADLEKKIAYEIEGAVWGGRHTKGKGFINDRWKYLEAHLLGWRVVSLTKYQLDKATINRLIAIK